MCSVLSAERKWLARRSACYYIHLANGVKIEASYITKEDFVAIKVFAQRFACMLIKVNERSVLKAS